MQIEYEAPRKLHAVRPSKEPMKVKMIEKTSDSLVFDLVHVEASFANALRRIMLSEVPSVAIETVSLYMNRSVMHDEVLAHRLGLVPINIDPELLEKEETVKFKLHVKCEGPADRRVYSGDLKIMPTPAQEERFSKLKNPAGTSEEATFTGLVHEDILLTILVPGEEIELEVECVQGVGADHSKFSPVATAAYRNLPEISVIDKTYKELVDICPVKVFKLKQKKRSKAGPDAPAIEEVVVDNARRCTFCRECLRYEVEHDGEENAAKVEIKRKVDHFVFHIETIGVLSPEVIFKRAIKILKQKVNNTMQALDTLEASEEDDLGIPFTDLEEKER